MDELQLLIAEQNGTETSAATTTTTTTTETAANTANTSQTIQGDTTSTAQTGSTGTGTGEGATGTEGETQVNSSEAATGSTDDATNPQGGTVTTDETFSKLLEELSGGAIKSKEDFSKFKTERDQLQQERDELKTKLQTDTYRTDYARKLDAWVEAGQPVEFFHEIHNLDTETMTPEEAVRAGKKLEKPHWSEAEIDLWFNKTYSQGEGHDQSDVDYGKLKMEDDAQNALSTIQKLQQLATVTKPEQANQQAEEQRLAPWNQNLGSIVNEANKITSTFKVGDDKEETFSYELSAEEKQQVQQKLQEVVNSIPQLQYNEAGIKAIRQVMETNIKAMIYEKAVAKAFTSGASKTHERHIQKNHNPSAAAKENEKPADTGKNISQDEVLKRVS